MLTQSRLKELLHYCPVTGVFTWIVARQRARCGDAAGRINHDGYRQIGIDGKRYSTHRLAWLYMTGEWPERQIDHRNGVRDDNRWSNLREATNAENGQNRGVRSNSTSGFMGVTWSKKLGMWQAQIGIAGRVKYLGYFTTQEDAHAAYLAAKAKHHQFQPTVRTT